MLATARVTAFHAGEDTTKDDSSKEGSAPPPAPVVGWWSDDADADGDEAEVELLKALPKNARMVCT